MPNSHSLNRARIITNLDDLKDDDEDIDHTTNQVLSNSKKPAEVGQRKQELEELLHELDEDSNEEPDSQPKYSHRDKRLNSEISDILNSER